MTIAGVLTLEHPVLPGGPDNDLARRSAEALQALCDAASLDEVWVAGPEAHLRLLGSVPSRVHMLHVEETADWRRQLLGRVLEELPSGVRAIVYAKGDAEVLASSVVDQLVALHLRSGAEVVGVARPDGEAGFPRLTIRSGLEEAVAFGRHWFELVWEKEPERILRLDRDGDEGLSPSAPFIGATP